MGNFPHRNEAVNDFGVVHGFSILLIYILSTFAIVCAASLCADVVTWA